MEYRLKNPTHAFTQKADRIANVLTWEFDISPVNNPSMKVRIKGIWDTGATNTVITEELANKLGIAATGKVKVNTASDTSKETATYLVDIFLKADFLIQGATVALGKVNTEIGLDCLIGMDIINLGDLSINCYEGKTWLSFRVPSRGHVDYVAQVNREIEIAQNHFKSGKRIDAPCSCGSGKKFKNCHGKDWEKV